MLVYNIEIGGVGGNLGGGDSCVRGRAGDNSTMDFQLMDFQLSRGPVEIWFGCLFLFGTNFRPTTRPEMGLLGALGRDLVVDFNFPVGL